MAFDVWLNEHFNFFRNVHTFKKMNKNPIFTQTILQEADDNDLEFILSEAKDRLKSTMDIADNLTNRSITLFSFAVAAMTTSIGYVATHFDFSANTIVLIPIIIILWGICSILKKNITPNDYFATGADPESIVVDGMFTNLQQKRPKWHLLVHMIEAYNERILVNRRENENKGENIEEVIKWVYAIPITAIIVYSLFFIFSKFLC
jgi:hypothetical protein